MTYSGGKALRHFADSSFIVNRLSNNNLTYVPIKIKAEKTRSSRYGLTLEMPLHENGIDIVRDVVSLAIAHEYIQQGGSWITFDDQKYQGTENFIKMLRENKDIFDKLCAGLYKDIIRPDKVTIVTVAEDILTEDDDDNKPD